MRLKILFIFLLFTFLLSNYYAAQCSGIGIDTDRCYSCATLADTAWSPTDGWKYITYNSAYSAVVFTSGFYNCDDYAACEGRQYSTRICNYRECLVDADCGAGIGCCNYVCSGCESGSTASCSKEIVIDGVSSTCTGGTKTCSDCSFGNCVFPQETCDGIDNDCDGFADNGLGMECVQNSRECIEYEEDPDNPDIFNCVEYGDYICDSSCKLIAPTNIAPKVTLNGPYSDLVNNIIPIKGSCFDDDGTISLCELTIDNQSACSISNVQKNGIGTSNASVNADVICSMGVDTFVRVTGTDNSNSSSQESTSLLAYQPTSSSPKVTVINTPPQEPTIDPASERRIVDGNLNLILNTNDPDVGFIDGQILKYSAYVSPNENNFPELTTDPEIQKTGLDKDEDNCVNLRVNDGIVNVDSSEEICFPVIDEIKISNSTIGGELENTRWIKNHFEEDNKYESITCEFTAHDKDNVEGRSNSELDYNISLFSIYPNETKEQIDSKSGSINSGGSAELEVEINNYKDNNYGYKVGTRFFCEVEVSDGFLEVEKSSFNKSSWTPSYINKDDNSPTNFVELINSAPYYDFTFENVNYIDRNEELIVVRAQINYPKDPDNHPGDTSQVYDYNGVIYKDFEEKEIDDFNSPIGEEDPWDRTFEIPLDAHDNYCFIGRAFDGLEYSNITDERCSEETPFVPVCSDLGLITNPKPESQVSLIDGDLAFRFMLSCDKSSKMQDQSEVKVTVDYITLNENLIKFSSSTIENCNATPQPLDINTNSNELGVYVFSLNYGDNSYNGEYVLCGDKVISENIDSLPKSGSIPGSGGENGLSRASLSIPDNNLSLIFILILIISFIIIPKKK